MRYIIYNPHSGYGKSKAESEALAWASENKPNLVDITEIADYAQFFAPLTDSDEVVIVGGDGTLNRFINATESIDIKCKLLYHASGTGNDFKTDVAPGDPALIDLAPYINELPTVTVKGKTYRFLNNVGFGIDGYCCEVGDAQKLKSDKKVNYTGIAIKGLLFHFKPVNATVTVDGHEFKYKNAWLAPTMNGRYYGGGMLPCPDQKRGSGSLSVMLMHGAGKIKTLMVFPKIFKGEHISHTDMVAIHNGKVITVRFDRPTPLQIDGETVLGVTEYTASVFPH